MMQSVSHDRKDESLEAKSRWFQSLTLEERMELLCEFTELALQNNPQIAEIGRAQSSTERIQVLRLPDRAGSATPERLETGSNRARSK
jgi:hypothetical protein